MRTPRLRLLSAILAVALFFTLLPVSALAEGGGSNANTGLTIGIDGNLNNWDVSHSISMKEVSPAVYEVILENKSYEDINGSIGFKFVKDNKYDDVWGGLAQFPAENCMMHFTMVITFKSAPALMLKIPSITLLSALI